MAFAVKKVLVSLNFSKSSLNALRVAIRMCRRHRAQLNMLYVSDTKYILPLATEYQQQIDDRKQKKLPEIMAEMTVSISKTYRIDVECHYARGTVVDTIHEKAKELNSELIVAGCSNKKKNRLFFENLSYLILKKAPCPVLVVPEHTTALSFKRILFPIRGTTNPEVKLPLTKSIVEKNNSALYILRLLNLTHTDSTPSIRKLIQQLKDEVERKRLTMLSEITHSGKAARQVMKAGEAVGADLIVINDSPGKSFLEFFTGGYARQMITNSNAAVLCINQ